MTRLKIRMEEFVGTEEFPQGAGMTWDSVTVELEDDEQIVDMQASHIHGHGFDTLRPVIRVWTARPA